MSSERLVFGHFEVLGKDELFKLSLLVNLEIAGSVFSPRNNVGKAVSFGLMKHNKELFWKELKPNPTEKEWKMVRDSFMDTLDEFSHLGWVKWVKKSDKNKPSESFIFEIKASIYRFIEMYQTEIQDINQTIQNYE